MFNIVCFVRSFVHFFMADIMRLHVGFGIDPTGLCVWRDLKWRGPAICVVL